MNVVVLGASDNPERMSHQAVLKLSAAGHTVFPVHPKLQTLLGISVYPALSQVPLPVDTLTVYVSAAISSKEEEAILRLKPRRVILNPGAENPALAEKLTSAGIQVLEACTLVLLSTKRF